MSRVYDRPIIIQRQDANTEEWADLYKIHAKINKASNDNNYLGSGASQSKRTLTFEVRYFKGLEAMGLERQYYRIIYQGVTYNVLDYDDYMLKHNSVKLLGVSY